MIDLAKNNSLLPVAHPMVQPEAVEIKCLSLFDIVLPRRGMRLIPLFPYPVLERDTPERVSE